MSFGNPPLGPNETAADGGDETIDLRRLFDMLWRRKMIIAGTMLVMTSATVLYVMQLTPLYIATTEIVVAPPRTNVVNIESVAPGLRTDYYTNDTQAAIIGSRVLAEKVVDQLDLMNNPAFNPDLRPPGRGLLDRLGLRGFLPKGFRFRDLIPLSWRTAIAGLDATAGPNPTEARPAPATTPEEARAYLREIVVDAYLAGLDVTPSDSSRVIEVSFTSVDPALAARLANAAVRVYIDDQIASKSKTTRQATVWLQERAVALKKKVEAAARAVERHRRRTGLVDVDGSNILNQQIAELTTKLIDVRAQRAEAEARYKQVKELLKSPGGIDSAAAVLRSQLIQRLREQEAEVVRKIAEMKTQYREGHPKMILARSELQDLVAKIETEVRKIATNFGNELEIAQVRERNLNDEIKTLKRKLDAQSGAEIKLRALETELDANRKLYDTILARLKETSVQDATLVQPDARVISSATVPERPSYPRKRLIVGIALAGSALLGVLIVLLLEHLDSGFRSRDQLETVTGLPVLGVVPRPRGRFASATPIYDDILDRPHSVLAESLRSLRTGLLLSDVDNPPRAVLVTSSVPGEGKSTTALALARTAAKAGQKCLIIDADLRKPRLQEAFGVPNGIGLIDYLSRDVPLEDMIHIDFRSGAHFILAGRAASQSADLLGSAKMRGLVRALRDTYDLVIIDTAPVLAVSDALVLMREVDKTIFLVRCERTPRDLVQAGLRELHAAGASLAGLVLSHVDYHKHSAYHYDGPGSLGRHGYGGDRAKASA